MTREELLKQASYHESLALALLTDGTVPGRRSDWNAEAADHIVCAKFLREVAESTPE